MRKIMTIIRKPRFILLSSLLLCFIVSGCVSSRNYRDLENRCATMELELAQAKEDKARLAKQKEEQEELMNRIIESLKEEIENKFAEIEMLEERLNITLVEKLFFESGSAEVKQKGRDILLRIAPTLKIAENHEIRIVGHADSIPIGKKLSATYLSNWELSTARATAIIQILQWGYGINPERLVAEGVGHYRPLVMETTENRASNRVVEIILSGMTDIE
jgi:chemotaxis protein MotB